jgi:uncharacterized membrane protein YbaN (DUF454 family)
MVMQPRLKRIIKLTCGWGFIILGFTGLFLPFLQGILFLLIGLLLLSSEYAWARRFFERIKTKYPQFYVVVEKWKNKF